MIMVPVPLPIFVFLTAFAILSGVAVLHLVLAYFHNKKIQEALDIAASYMMHITNETRGDSQRRDLFNEGLERIAKVIK